MKVKIVKIQTKCPKSKSRDGKFGWWVCMKAKNNNNNKKGMTVSEETRGWSVHESVNGKWGNPCFTL